MESRRSTSSLVRSRRNGFGEPSASTLGYMGLLAMEKLRVLLLGEFFRRSRAWVLHISGSREEHRRRLSVKQCRLLGSGGRRGGGGGGGRGGGGGEREGGVGARGGREGGRGVGRHLHFV